VTAANKAKETGRAAYLLNERNSLLQVFRHLQPHHNNWQASSAPRMQTGRRGKREVER
jgi:hypothetical protein